jgi:signal transduction histidine kinase
LPRDNTTARMIGTRCGPRASRASPRLAAPPILVPMASPAPRRDPSADPGLELHQPIQRINDLIHELGTLLRGSLQAVAGSAGLPTGTPALEHQLHAAAQRLEQMADLVHSAMQGASKPLGSPSLHKSRPVTIGEAAQHAADVLAPLAAAHNVALRVDIPVTTGLIPAGALYTVILNGLQNAIEAVARTGRHGSVTLRAQPEPAPQGLTYGRDTRDWVSLHILDDGVGAPPDPSRCFDLGFTTKPRGAGVGLAVAKNVVRGMGGTIDLAPRSDAAGSVLRVLFPSLTSSSNLAFGGAA